MTDSELLNVPELCKDHWQMILFFSETPKDFFNWSLICAKSSRAGRNLRYCKAAQFSKNASTLMPLSFGTGRRGVIQFTLPSGVLHGPFCRLSSNNNCENENKLIYFHFGKKPTYNNDGSAYNFFWQYPGFQDAKQFVAALC
jgi:hypothetical protein